MNPGPTPLFALLSQLLIAYAQRFELELSQSLGMASAEVPSLAMCANVIRLISPGGTVERDLPRLSAIAAPTMKSMTACLRRHGWITVEDHLVQLTAQGEIVQQQWTNALTRTDAWLCEAIGADHVATLRASFDDATTALAGLPHFPMPAPHRGAHPTGW